MKLNLFLPKKSFIVFLYFGVGACNAYATWCVDESLISSVVERDFSRAALKFLNDAPVPLPRLRTEGLMPGQGIYDQSVESKKDFKKIEALTIGWKSTKNKDFLSAAERFLLDWATIYTPSGNPIDETNFTILFKSFEIIESNLNPESRDFIKKWILGFSNVYVNEIYKVEASENPQSSNWHSHRIKIAVTSAAAVGSNKLIDVIEPYFHKHVNRNILIDGSIIDFHKRDSISYAVYSLTPILETALVARSLKKDWLSEKYSSRNKILSAIDWMIPYMSGSKVHVEFANSPYKFDKLRADAQLPGHLRQAWNPSSARELIWLAAYFDNKYLEIAKKISPTPPAYLSSCYGIL